jgi:8-oxo-dGTP diphosphatase
MEVSPGIKRNAVMIVLQHDRQFLMLKRAKPPHQGKFTPVGGKIEPHENPIQAALRETWEETGIELPSLRYAGSIIETAPNNYNWNCLIFQADIPMLPPPPCDEGELYWVAFEDIPNLPAPETDWFIFKYILDGKPFMFNADYNEQLEMLNLREEIEGKILA